MTSVDEEEARPAGTGKEGSPEALKVQVGTADQAEPGFLQLLLNSAVYLGPPAGLWLQDVLAARAEGAQSDAPASVVNREGRICKK